MNVIELSFFHKIHMALDLATTRLRRLLNAIKQLLNAGSNDGKKQKILMIDQEKEDLVLQQLQKINWWRV